MLTFTRLQYQQLEKYIKRICKKLATGELQMNTTGIDFWLNEIPMYTHKIKNNAHRLSSLEIFEKIKSDNLIKYQVEMYFKPHKQTPLLKIVRVHIDNNNRYTIEIN